MPEIQLGPAEGRLLYLLLTLIRAHKVVEIGTLAGYSALWMARALPPGGHLWTIEADPRHAGIAAEVIGEAGLGDRVTVLEGDAAEVLPKLSDSGPFCAVFLDADKARYDVYGRWATENLRTGGLLIGDNAYLFGRLLEDSEDARAMRRFHQEMAHRQAALYPPYTRLAKLLCESTNPERVHEASQHLATLLQRHIPDPRHVVLLGPAEAPVVRIQNRYRWHMLLKGVSSRVLHQCLTSSLADIRHDPQLLRGVRISVDVDPMLFL